MKEGVSTEPKGYRSWLSSRKTSGMGLHLRRAKKDPTPRSQASYQSLLSIENHTLSGIGMPSTCRMS
jgi:hypothetical protein